MVGAVLVTPASLVRPVPKQKAQEGWTGLQASAARPLAGTGPAWGAGTRTSCGSHRPTWWQSGRLQHAELGKLVPATRAGGRVVGLHGEVGLAQSWGGGGHPVPLEGFSSPKPAASFREEKNTFQERQEVQASLE